MNTTLIFYFLVEFMNVNKEIFTKSACLDHVPLFNHSENSLMLLDYLNTQISVPKLTVSRSSSHCTKHIGIDFNNFLYRL